MPLFARLRNKGANSSNKDKSLDAAANAQPLALTKPRWQSNWNSKEVDPVEVADLIHACTLEMKSRAEALDAPFLLLPFRPDTETTGARIFISNYFKSNAAGSKQFRGAALQQELRLTEPVVLCSIMKWCWSRIPSGVVTWPVYEGFRMGERESNMARNAFTTFIPIGAESPERTRIIFDFFDVLAAIAAHGKLNGLGGRKLSRLAGWWAFEHYDEGKGFEGGYESWNTAAEASSHLFFAYLRSLSPDTDPSMNVIERIPRSLQALLASTEYPPETPTLLQRTTPRVVMMVDSVSPTPFALLRRAKHFEYRENDKVLRQFSEYEDPIDALTEENKRVLIAISSTNQSQAIRSRHGRVAKPDESWSAFQNLGFSDIDDTRASQTAPNSVHGSPSTIGRSLRSEPRSFTYDADRPTTPSWADFLSSGFNDDETAAKPTTLLYPPAQVLPPLGSRASQDTNMQPIDENLAPGELAAITSIELDDAFWWVWMTSLAGEEPAGRKAVFGRCALIETNIMNGRWLIMEEQVKGASPEPVEGVYVAPKKRIFSFSKRTRLGRKKSSTKPSAAHQEMPERVLSATPSKTSIGPSQHAKIRAAAAALTRSQQESDQSVPSRRGRHEEHPVSTLTVGLQSEAVSALKWTSAYDKNAIRSQYLGDAAAGKGGNTREDSARNSFVTPEAAKTSSTTPAAATTSTPAATVAVPSAAPAAADVPTQAPPPVSTAAPTPKPIRPIPISPRVTEVATPVEQAATESVKSSPVQTTPPKSVRSQAMAAFQKDMGADGVNGQKGNKVERKPVRRFEKVDDHPAFRQTTPTSSANPAAAAAMRAMQSRTQSSPDANKDASFVRQQGQNGAIKKLFGSKKDETDGSNLSVPAAGPGFTRRVSLLRKKTEGTAPAAQRTAPAEPTEQPSMAHGAAAAAAQAADPMIAERRSDAQERANAEHEFARFDQGPMADMPGAMPIEDDEHIPAPVAPSKDAHVAQPIAETATDATATDATATTAMIEPTAGAAERDFIVPVQDHHDPEIVHDHWAQVRESAAKRATASRISEDAQSRPSQSLRTDDGDTSGEETIESRVARIKARVAELTGNMDSSINHR